MVIRFLCEYNGSEFKGFQKQGSLRTVQSVLEEALSKYFKETIKIIASGRTDAGVHARGQTCSFVITNETFTITSKPPHLCAPNKATQPNSINSDWQFKTAAAINSFLTPDVAVRDFCIADDNFHAQFCATKKTYIYRCYVSQFRKPLLDWNHFQLYKMPDINLMRNFCKQEFIGEKNFAEYTTEKVDSKNFVRTIHSFEINLNEDEISFIICGSGFMRNMVRILVGRAIDIGFGRVENIRKQTLPAKGLTLESVEY